jgi:hypothetical protein
MTIAEIVASIDRRLIQAQVEIAQLEGARQALIDGVAPAATPRPRRAPRKTRRRTSARPRYGVVPAGRLIALLEGSEGMSTPELAKATSGRADRILVMLRELERADQIRRTGERRATRWHLISDEDRVAARAVDIAAQRKRRSKKSA